MRGGRAWRVAGWAALRVHEASSLVRVSSWKTDRVCFLRARCSMALRSVKSDLLMSPASRSTLPEERVSRASSDPAKSTRLACSRRALARSSGQQSAVSAQGSGIRDQGSGPSPSAKSNARSSTAQTAPSPRPQAPSPRPQAPAPSPHPGSSHQSAATPKGRVRERRVQSESVGWERVRERPIEARVWR